MTFLRPLSTIFAALLCFAWPIDGSPASRELTAESVIVKVQFAKDQPPLELTLKEFMQKYNIPGLSVAVIDNYKIAWAKGFGVTVPGGSEPVIPTTLFQAGSISKPVAATGALWLVERGKLTLDEDVNNKLKSWKVPENEFTRTEKVTLRRLMSHTAGLTVHGFPGYAAGKLAPTLVQILNGEKPANTAPIRVDVVPGSRMRYSGGGVTIEQQLMIDVTGKPFPQFMKEAVLSKIGMSNSTYEQPLPAALAVRAATGTRPTPHIVDAVAREYGWSFNPAQKSAGHVLMLLENVKSTQTALDFYARIKQGEAPEYKLEEDSLNMLGYHLLRQKRMDEAIKVFQLNVQEYPKSWNPYDSLAEAYAAAGQKDLAIQNYEKSLALNPNNKNGAEKLRKLKDAQ